MAEDNPVRVVDVFVDELDLAGLGFEGAAATGRPGYHPATLLKLYVYGYLNQVQSSRRLEREARRNVELMWLTGKLAPDFKTIADFRRDNGAAIQAACRQFVLLCRQLGLFAGGPGGGRRQQVQGGEHARQELHAGHDPAADGAGRRAASQRYLGTLDTADRQEGEAAEAAHGAADERLDRAPRARCASCKAMEAGGRGRARRQVSLTDPDARAMATAGRGTGIVGYNVQAAVEPSIT